MKPQFLFLFTTNPTFAASAVKSGVDFIIIDWERDGKMARQAATNFQIGQDTIEDVRALAGHHGLPIFVRINPLGENTAREIRQAVNAGSSGIMLPLARSRRDVVQFLSLIPKGVRTLVQIETQELASDPASIADLPWDFVHIGLNDLMLARNAPSIWTAVLDGTVEGICDRLEGRMFGFGGITVAGSGFPIPARLVLLEMARLGCSMGILRRSFREDVTKGNVASEIPRIRELLSCGPCRNSHEWERDRLLLENAIKSAGG